MDWVIRFLAGGLVVSFFATLGDVLRPKSFAGLFGAAPSVALATVTLTIYKEGKVDTAEEAASMLLAALAFLVYAAAASYVLRRRKMSALATTVALMPVWLAVSLGLWAALAGKFWW
ncbi:MAG: DUF3147 family protein [Acidobacteriaceae bacterium]